ncbi:hypothetical protein CR513_13144, partial [Mucuna pruriens]
MYIDLLTTFDDLNTLHTISIWYLIVATNTSYGVLIAWLTMNSLGTIVSTPHLIMKFPSLNGRVVTIKANQKMVQTKPSKEGNISAHVEILTNIKLDPKMTTSRYTPNPLRKANISTQIEILTDIELDPRPPNDKGSELIEKLKYIPLTGEEHHTQIGERMQGPHREWLVSTFHNHVDLFA